MSSILDKTISVRNILKCSLALGIVFLLYCAYAYLRASFEIYAGGVPVRTSPYWNMIPTDCHGSVSSIGHYVSAKVVPEGKISEWPRSIRYFSLPESEQQNGEGMHGLPCLGYEFISLLHAQHFTAVKRFVNSNGEVVAEVTFKILKGYKDPVAQSEWSLRNGWLETKPSAKSGLVEIEQRP